jgi:hypothetical protein
MFVSGTSTRKVGEVAETLMGVAPSASAVSRLNKTLTEQFEAWRSRTLQGHWRVLYLDGIYLCLVFTCSSSFPCWLASTLTSFISGACHPFYNLSSLTQESAWSP